MAASDDPNRKGQLSMRRHMSASSEDVGGQVRAAARGDRQAAEVILRRLLPRVRNLVRYLVRGDNDVDDITQKALVAVLQGLPSFRGEAPLERWADRVVARETFRHLKRQRLREAREQPSDQAGLFEATPEPSAEATYWARRAAASALDALPESQRVAVALHHAAGLTVPELAELLEVSKDTVKSRLRLGMEKLRASLKQAEEKAG